MTTSEMALTKKSPRRSALTLAKAQVSQLLSHRLPHYLTATESQQLIEATENERDRLFHRLLWETGVGVSEAIRLKLGDVGRHGVRVLGKGSRESVVFVQDGLVSAILFQYSNEEHKNRQPAVPTAKRIPVALPPESVAFGF